MNIKHKGIKILEGKKKVRIKISAKAKRNHYDIIYKVR